jgi:signal transduction histidine kinase
MQTISRLNAVTSRSKPTLLLQYARQGLLIAEKENDKHYIAEFNEYLGRYYAIQKSLDSAKIYYDAALKTAVGIGDAKRQRSVMIAFANLYKSFSNDHTAVDYFLKALKLAEESGDYEAQALIYTSLADVFRTLYNDDKALEYSLKAIDAADKTAMPSLKVTPTVFLSHTCRNRKEYPQALEYAQQAYAYNKTSGDYANALTINQMLALLYSETNKPDSALLHAQECLDIAQKVNAPQYLLFGWNAMSNAYRANKMWRESADAALNARNADSTNIFLATNIYCNLLHANIALGDMKAAEHYFLLYDSVFQQYMDKQIHESLAEQEVKYQTETKELTINNLQSEKRIQRLLMLTGGLVLILIALLIGVVARLESRKRHLAEQEVEIAKLATHIARHEKKVAEQLAEQETKKVAAQAALQAEMLQRARIGQDLHDGVQGLLAAAILSLGDEAEGTRTYTIIQKSIREVRRLARVLSDNTLNEFGLREALFENCSWVDIINFRHIGKDCRYSALCERAAYLCAMELITNAIKHSGATLIEVQLIQHEDSLSITVQDNGKGFDPEKVKHGVGFKSLANRLAAFNSYLDIDSSPDNTGASIRFEIKNIA